jgi:nitrate reductase gamma subunit
MEGLTMNVEFFKTLGQWAGIGGIALGVFLLLFREVIRKSIFPKLNKNDAHKFLRLVMILIWSVAIVGIAAWVWSETHSRFQPISSEAGPHTNVNVDHGVGSAGDITAHDITINDEKKNTTK